MNAPERTQAWMRFAREDATMARLAFREEIWNQACFHSQQSAEKALKALLESTGIRPPKIHSVAELVERLRQAGVSVADEI